MPLLLGAEVLCPLRFFVASLFTKFYVTLNPYKTSILPGRFGGPLQTAMQLEEKHGHLHEEMNLLLIYFNYSLYPGSAAEDKIPGCGSEQCSMSCYVRFLSVSMGFDLISPTLNSGVACTVFILYLKQSLCRLKLL